MSDKRERNGELGSGALGNWETPPEDLVGIRKFLLVLLLLQYFLLYFAGDFVLL